MKSITIIPARGGSKGVPQKNIALVGGKPLIQWTIDAAIRTDFSSDIYVSSDDRDILELSVSLGVHGLQRPEQLAQDNTPTEQVITDCLERLNITKEHYRYIILLQPTSPLRTTYHINQAMEKIITAEADALISVIKPDKHPLKSFLIDKNGYMQGLINNQYPFMPRQELPEVGIPNGAIYIVKTERYIATHSLYQRNTIPYFMRHEDSIDIDTQADILRATEYLNHRNKYEQG